MKTPEIFIFPPIFMALFGFSSALLDPSFGVDEAYTMHFISGSYAQLISFCVADVHPPLYFILLKAWVDFWQYLTPIPPVALAKMFSTVPLFLLMFIGSSSVRRLWGDKVNIIYQLCFLAGGLTHYASLLRMYSLGSLFVTICALAVCQILHSHPQTDAPSPKYLWGMLCLSTAAAAYTHYFACISVVFLWICFFVELLIQHRSKDIFKMLACGLLSVVLYFPWLPSMFQQLTTVKGSYWIEPLNVKILLHAVGRPFVTQYTIGSVLVGLIVATVLALVVLHWLLHCLHTRPKTEDHLALLCMSIVPGTIFLAALAEWLLRPVFVARYIVPAIPCLWLGVSLASRHIQNDRHFRFLVGTLCTCAIISCSLLLYTDWTQGKEYRRFMTFHSEQIGEEQILDNEYHLRETLYFTHPQWNHQTLEENSQWDGNTRVWIFSSDSTIPYQIAQNHPGTKILDYGEFLLWEYEFNIYSLIPLSEQ